jgi:hypothetical protein
MNRKLKFASVAVAVALMAACAGNETKPAASVGGSVSAADFSGVLADYSKLKPVDGVDGSLRYVDTSMNLRPYKKVIIDPVLVFMTHNPEYHGLQPDALKRMGDAMQTAFLSALVDGYQIVNAPGPDVMRLRLAITGVQAARPPLGASDFIPIKAVFNVARSAAGEAPQVAEISAEMEMLDPNGRVIGAAVASRKGDKALAQGASITWQDLQASANFWAKNLRNYLDYARGYAKN